MVEYAYKENGVMKLKPVALSLSQADIDEIATELLEAMQPDWQNAISLTAAQLTAGYTAPADGVVVGYSVPTSGISYATVNGIVISRGDHYPNNYVCFTNVQCQVSEGDIFKIDHVDAYTNSFSFVPFKTSNPVSLRPLDPHKIDTAILNHWDDITSDFSTAGSTSGVTLNYVKYNPALRMLKYKITRNQSTAAGGAEIHKLIYNGSEMISFSANSTILLESINFVSSLVAGYEVSNKIDSSNQITVDVINRNTSSAWESGHYFTGVIYL